MNQESKDAFCYAAGWAIGMVSSGNNLTSDDVLEALKHYELAQLALQMQDVHQIKKDGHPRYE